MPGTVHLLVGAVIAALVPDMPLMVTLAFFSHYVLDFIPHLDPDTFAAEKKPYTWWQRATLAADVILIVTFLIAIFLLRRDPFGVILGAVVAQLPDLLVPLESYSAFYPLHAFHEITHWDKSRANRWAWYMPALVAPVVISLTAVAVLWFKING